MLCLLNLLDLTTLAPPNDHFFSDVGNVNLFLAQADANSHTYLIIYSYLFWVLKKTRIPKVLGHPLTCLLTQTLEGG